MELSIFSKEQFGEIQTIVKDNDIWFVANDVCKCLDLSNVTEALKRVDDEDKSNFSNNEVGGRPRLLVNESGLYNLVFLSRKPEAKAFKKWVTSEVIPSIRKHGGYLTPQLTEDVLLNPDLIIRLATNLKDERAKNAELQLVIEGNQPKVLFADAITTHIKSMSIGSFSKILRQNGVDIGRGRLFEWLREHNYLMKQGEDYNLPQQSSMNDGLFEIKLEFYQRNGCTEVYRKTLITAHGQQYFVNKFLSLEKVV